MHKRIVLLIALILLTNMTGCAGGPLSTRERLTLGGGALGAATGAVVGAATGGSAAVGAAIGGPVGLLGGFLIGDSLQGASSTPHSAPRSNCSVQGYQRSSNKAASGKSVAAGQSSARSGEVF